MVGASFTSVTVTETSSVDEFPEGSVAITNEVIVDLVSKSGADVKVRTPLEVIASSVSVAGTANVIDPDASVAVTVPTSV